MLSGRYRVVIMKVMGNRLRQQFLSAFCKISKQPISLVGACAVQSIPAQMGLPYPGGCRDANCSKAC